MVSVADGVWGESFDNALEGEWIVQTPPKAVWGKDRVVQARECRVLTDILSNVTDTCARDGIPANADFNHPLCTNVGSPCSAEIGGGVCGTLDATRKHDGDPLQPMCLGDADPTVDDLYNLLITAETAIDITTLTPPDGRFEAAIRNAITRLADKKNPPRIRIFTGSYPTQAFNKVHDYAFDANGVLTSLTRDIVENPGAPINELQFKNKKMRVAVGKSTIAFDSWNHSKIVAIDGKVALVGGTNYWAPDYLISAEPVHDLSIRVKGTAAAHAQLFTNQLWDHLCVGGDIGLGEIGPGSGDGSHVASIGLDGFDVCKGPLAINGQSHAFDADFRMPPVAKDAPKDGVPILAVGNLGPLSVSENAGAIALPALIRAAKTRVRIAQQDIGPPKLPGGAWPVGNLSAIKDRLNHGVEVEIVVSNPGGPVGSYGHGWTIDELREHIRDVDDTELSEEAACKLHIAAFSGSESRTWASGTNYYLHDKLMIVDDQAFYVGSQNAYTSHLVDYGYIVDSKTATTAMNAYYDTMWGYSAKNTDDEVWSTCHPRK
jgi:phosphatidylserine/phosphatidylglycerophosphate/cardiolipin synthase-like enzyme